MTRTMTFIGGLSSYFEVDQALSFLLIIANLMCMIKTTREEVVIPNFYNR